MALSGAAVELMFTAAGLVNIGLAAWLLALDPRSKVHRAFALFLVLRGMLNLSGNVPDMVGRVDLGDRFQFYFNIAVPFAAAHFAVVFRRVHGGGTGGPRRWEGRGLSVVLLGSALACELLYFADHALAGPDGPLYVFYGLNLAGYAFIALVLARRYVQEPEVVRRLPLLLAAVGFALNPAYGAVNDLGLVVLGNADGARDGAWAMAPYVWAAVTFALVSTVFVYLFRHRRDQAAEHEASPLRRSMWGLAVAGGSGALAAALARTYVGAGLDAALATFWIVTLPVLVSYAIIKHRLFGIEVRVRRTITGSTVAAAFVGVFFITTEVAQTYISDQAGPWVGIAVVAVMVLALAPLQSLAHRFAQASVPATPEASELTREERVAMYSEQVRVAWADGQLTAKERRLLNVSRDKLGLTPEEASELERKVLGA